MIRFAKALLACLCLVVGGVAQAQTLSAATLEWAPFTGEKLDHGGVAVDLVREAFKRSGYDLNVQYLPWERAMSETRNENIDVLIGAWYSQERATIYHMSEPFLHNRILFIKNRGDSFKFNGLDSLQGKTVGVVRNYTYSEAFSQAQHFRKAATSNLASNLKKLAYNRIDLTLADEIVARHTLSHELPKLQNRFAFSDRALSEESLHIAVSRGHADAEQLMKAFHTGLAQLKADGSYRRILARHGL